MSTIVDTPGGIRLYQLLSLRYSLDIEVATGMHRSGGVSTLAAVKRNFGVISNTKKGALEELDAMLQGVDVGRAFADGEMFVEQPRIKCSPYNRGRCMAAFERGVELGKQSHGGIHR